MSIVWIIATFWFVGVLLGLTPCAITLMLIMSTIYGESNKAITKVKSLLLSFTYMFSLALTYAIIGILVASLGFYFKPSFQNNWIIGSFSLILIILGLSSLGLFNLQLPHHWLKSTIGVHNRVHKYGLYIEVAFIGVLATVIAAPCVLAPLVGLLSYIAKIGDVRLGGIALFFAGVGFGTPLIAFYLIGGSILQKAGEWQNGIKHFFGILLLGVAIWLLEHMIPPKVIMFLWSFLAIFTAIYMGVLINKEKDSSSDAGQAVCSLDGEEVPQKNLSSKNTGIVSKLISILILLYGIILFFGALLGNVDPLSPLGNQTFFQSDLNKDQKGKQI